MGVTLVLLGILGAIFLKGFNEAIGVAVVLVGVVPQLECGGDGGGRSMRCCGIRISWRTGRTPCSRNTGIRWR